MGTTWASNRHSEGMVELSSARSPVYQIPKTRSKHADDPTRNSFSTIAGSGYTWQVPEQWNWGMMIDAEVQLFSKQNLSQSYLPRPGSCRLFL